MPRADQPYGSCKRVRGSRVAAVALGSHAHAAGIGRRGAGAPLSRFADFVRAQSVAGKEMVSKLTMQARHSTPPTPTGDHTRLQFRLCRY
jgi:hypothetical protein